uniref:Uncharacterized protein n=1 Tax=Lutzomyia longipalpis TaxID=7200 RepID=A0A7G3ALW7_LUTLO
MCYTCDSDDDPGCFSQPEDQRAFLCRIMNVGSESFRCITITATKGDKTVALRRCGIENECELVLDSNNALDWGGEIFPDAQCSICASDYCNNDVGNKISLF